MHDRLMEHCFGYCAAILTALMRLPVMHCELLVACCLLLAARRVADG
jgi:ABC-type transport system involved in cytochrome c biogenesis permease subunit